MLDVHFSPILLINDFCVKEHLDFMDNAGTNNFEFQSFKQLENDYSGYQSLTDVPKAMVYTEDILNIQVNNKSADTLSILCT